MDTGDSPLEDEAQSGQEAIYLEPVQGRRVEVQIAASDQFAARLVKAYKQRSKWARKQGITCYRVYDADLPDYAVCIDIYEGTPATPGRWVVVAEYAAPKHIDPERATMRLADVMALIPPILQVDASQVFLKVRQKSKGGSQYSEHQNEHAVALVEENGHIFEVNFSDYLDTGLFLDHRNVRKMLEDMAKGTRFLNLFAYTGSATCYAAAGGAYATTTVDLSRTYLEWAVRNMEQNGFKGTKHEFIQADTMPWIQEQRHTKNRWDLIFVDPPTFSNSARMRKRGFEVQRDHAELIIGASRLLTKGGTLVFSCNLRSFKPDTEALAKAGVELKDISAESIPEDFARNARIHHCYLAQRTVPAEK